MNCMTCGRELEEEDYFIVNRLRSWEPICKECYYELKKTNADRITVEV